MANLLAEKQNVFWHDYDALVVAGDTADWTALSPVHQAIGNGFDTTTITLFCGKPAASLPQESQNVTFNV